MLTITKNNYNSIIDLETCLLDGRLTEPANNDRFEWRKMIEEVKKKGRPLTEEESDFFKIKIVNNEQ